MAKRFKEITMLPSKIIIGDNPPVLLSSLTAEQFEECSKKMTERVAGLVNRWFDNHPEDAQAFLDFHPTYLAMKAAKEAEKAKQSG